MREKIVRVSDAILSRRSLRAFTSDAVPLDLVRDILDVARRAPSGGNLQPWRVTVLSGAARQRLVDAVAQKMAAGEAEVPEYNVYPPDLTDPYKSRRRKVGEDLYTTIGVPREDRAGKFRQLAKNFAFFGAPVGLMITIDRQMEVGQFADLGMFLENVMLLARQHGLDTCPQEAWAQWPQTVKAVINHPDNEMLFCGVALGYADQTAVINSLETERASIEEFTIFLDQ